MSLDKALLTPALLATVQKVAAAFGVSVEALLGAALSLPSSPGAALAAKSLAPETITALSALPWLQQPTPPEGQADPLAPVDAALSTPPDVVITVDGVHVTCPCTTTRDDLLARLTVEVPHLFAPGAPPVDLHRVIGADCRRLDSREARHTGPLDLHDGDVFLTHGRPKPKPVAAPPAEPPPVA